MNCFSLATCCPSRKSADCIFPVTGWPFGSLVCKMSGMVQGISVSASVFTLVAIAVDRYSGCILLLVLLLHIM